MDKIAVKWTEGRSKGTTSVVKRSAIKSGTIAVGNKVSVVWGKSKKTYNAEVVDDGSTVQAQRPTASREEPLFTLEMVDPPPADSQGPPPCEERQPALIEKMERLTDIVAGLEARILSRFDSVEDRLTKLQADVDCLKCARTGVEVQPTMQEEEVPVSLSFAYQEVETPTHFPDAAAF